MCIRDRHLRAVLDYPLGDAGAIVPVTVMANVLGAAQPPAMTADERLHHLFARMPDARVHLYLSLIHICDQLVRTLLRELGGRIVAWRAARGADWQLAADYRARSLTIGSRVRAHLPGGKEIVGTATGIDDQARLCLDIGGETVVVSAGDVVHLRY